MLRKVKSVVSCQLSVVRREIFLCLLSATLLILSFPNFNLWIFAWFGFVPLFFAIEGKSKGRAFLLSYIMGIIFWFGTIYWLIHVTLAGLILLVLYLALFFGVFGLLISRNLQLSTYYLILSPAIWVLLEYLRSHLLTGFGWALLGYSQYLNLPAIQIADITGVYGVSFLIMMVNVTIYQVVSCPEYNYSRRLYFGIPKRHKYIYYIRGQLSVVRKIKKVLFPTLLLTVALSYGYYKLSAIRYPLSANPLKVCVIQGNIPQELKWQAYSQEFILDRYIKLSREAAVDKPDLIIWPESAVSGFLFRQEDERIFKNIFSLAKDLNTNLLIGSVVEDNSCYFNSAILINLDGKIVKRYDKIHLVPFGEYIPLGKIMGFLQTIVPIGDFIPGKEYTVFSLNETTSQRNNESARFSVLICFEDLFPELARKFVKQGAGLLVNITNDAWFGRTSSPFQHVALSVMRAVENHRFLVRAANTGVSCFITSEGAIKSLVSDNKGRAIFITGHKTADISAQHSITFYTRHGDAFILACLILVICGIIGKDRKRG